ncbi:hypothetical protein JHK82_043202 [Glycine max]|nr:hypothetical protein JHK86_043241 [Glycine max]KAG5106232.1 hypothetical protein JHK82_043202 [Glycine max]
MHTFSISKAATTSGLIHSLLGTCKTTSFLEMSLSATNPRPSGTTLGFTGVLAETTPSLL